MGTLPRWLRWAHVVFNVSAVIGGGFGLLFIWHPTEDEIVLRVFGSVLVVLTVSALVLAGYRTAHLRSMLDR